jgi:cell division protein FtsQ
MWNNVRLLNALANSLLLLAIFAVLAVGSIWFVNRPMFVIRDVMVSSASGQHLKHVSAPLLKAAARKELDTQPNTQPNTHSVIGGNLLGSARYFFGVPLEALRESFEQVPWVRQANIRRVWPNSLHIELEEHKATAVWGDGRLVNAQGELFSANLGEAEEQGPLPQFAGPNEASNQVLRRYVELVQWLTPLNVRPESLTLSTRHAWTVKLDDGTTLLLGREQGVAMEDRISKWVASVPRLQSRLASRPELYDLRYPNGFAVRAVALVDDAKKLDSKPE